MAPSFLRELNVQAPGLSQFLPVRHVLRRSLLNHLPPAHLLSSTKLTHALRGSYVSRSLGPSSYCPYSPECVEGEFYEVHLCRILGVCAPRPHWGWCSMSSAA